MPSLCLMKFSKTPKVWRFSSDGPQYRHRQLIETNARLVHMIATGIAKPHDP